MGMDARRDKTKRTARDIHTSGAGQSHDKDHPGEYHDVTEDVHKLWTSWTAAPNASDLWRRIESSGFDNSLKTLSKIKAELSILSSVSVDEARQLTCLMEELSELLAAIRVAFMDNEKEIFDSDEKEKRYLTSTCPLILEVWSAYSSFSTELATRLSLKLWQNTADHEMFLKSVAEVSSNSVKLIILAVDLAGFHSQEDAGALHKAAIHEVEGACSDLENFVNKVMTLPDRHAAKATMMEMAGWNLYGIWHLDEKIIKVGVEARSNGDGFDEYENFVKTTNSMLKQLKLSRGETPAEEEQAPVKEATPEKKTRDNKKGSKWSKKSSAAIKQEPVEENKGKTREECLDVLQKVDEEYNKYSDDAWNKKRLPKMDGPNGVQVMYRMESYSHIGKLKISLCPMTERKAVLESLCLNETHEMFSDLFLVTPDPLACSQPVTIRFPVLSVAPMDDKYSLCLKLKKDGKWENIEDPEQILVDGAPFLVFSTTSCEAFTAVTHKPTDTCVLSPQGVNYCSDTESKVEIQFPEGIVDNEVTVRVKLLEFDQAKYEKQFVGIVAASVGIDLSPEKHVEMKKRFTLQLPIKGDFDDKDTELVVARCQGDMVQVLDKRQINVKTCEHGVYSVDMAGFWCVAILRIRRVFLNMRESVKREFLVGYGKAQLCNILTYIDHMTRGHEQQGFIMEVVEKYDADSVAEMKKGVGLIEIKKSRSKDILMRRGDEVQMVTDGQIRPTEPLPDEHYILCYLNSGTNVIHVSTEIKRDPEKHPDAMLVYKRCNEESTVLHCLSILSRDLSELPTENITARNVSTSTLVDTSGRDKRLEESAVNILKMESLMSLARELTFEEGKTLGEHLGVKSENIQHIKEAEQNETSANFQILCDWRGRSARSAMADFLVSSLKAVGKVNYAEIVSDVRSRNRGLERTDFSKDDTKNKHS